jgi:hypothetical protein
MKVKNWLLGSAVAAVLASCGDAGSKTDDADTTVTTGNTTIETQTTKKNVDVPVATRTSFEAKYPQASDVNWVYHYDADYPIDWELAGWPTVDTTYFVATWNQNNDDYWVWYDEDGQWLGTVSEVNDHASLPSAVNKTLQSDFASYKIVSIDKENDKNRTAYEIDLENGADKLKVLIAENGKVMKKKGNESGEKVKEKSNPKDPV